VETDKVKENVSADKPVLLCGMHPHEEKLGLIDIKFKRHKYFERMLKSNDQLVFSAGWRK